MTSTTADDKHNRYDGLGSDMSNNTSSHFIDYHITGNDDGPPANTSVWNDEVFNRTRFTVETLAAMLSSLLNAAVLLTLLAGTLTSCNSCSGGGSVTSSSRRTRTVYHNLFINLMLANSLSSVTSWFCNNIFYLASNSFVDKGICIRLISLIAAYFVSASFGLSSILTVLGFAIVQYFAICRPLQSMAVISTTKVIGYIVMSWILPVITSSASIVILIIANRRSDVLCGLTDVGRIHVISEIGINTTTGIVMAVYVTASTLCSRIYFEVHQLHHRLFQFRADTEVQVHQVHQLHHRLFQFRADNATEMTQERRAFVTTIMLLATLTFFYLPHTILYLVTVNGGMSAYTEHPAMVFYMTLMPYAKMLSDPIVYGVRMYRRASQQNHRRFARRTPTIAITGTSIAGSLVAVLPEADLRQCTWTTGCEQLVTLADNHRCLSRRASRTTNSGVVSNTPEANSVNVDANWLIAVDASADNVGNTPVVGSAGLLQADEITVDSESAGEFE